VKYDEIKRNFTKEEVWLTKVESKHLKSHNIDYSEYLNKI